MAGTSIAPEAKSLELVRQAILAPSSHNTQPWTFRVTGEQVEIHADRTRALPVNDPLDRELTISCGCALMNLVVAARRYGRLRDVQVLPELLNPDLIARVRLLASAGEAQSGAKLFDAIRLRRTYRKRFAERKVAAAALKSMATAAEAGEAWFEVVQGDEARHEVADLVAEADRMQWADPSWRRELSQWMHPRRSGDGLVIPGLTSPLTQMVVRSFDRGDGEGAKDRELADASPVLALIGTERDRARDWVVAGQALQAVLLTAQSHGLQASFLNQPVQVAPLRARLQSLLAHAGQPQLLIRLGYPTEEAPATPRRPLEEVIETA
jgi:nitroreductase